MDIPHVPHLFVQRIDALPEAVRDQVLISLQEQRASVLVHASSSSGGDSKSGAKQQLPPPSRKDLEKLLKQHRREELAADADSADFSDEPYDSIPRQVELQCRTYVRMYPETVATRAKLETMLTPLDGGGGDGGAASTSERQEDGVAAAATVGGRSLKLPILGGLPSAAELQRKLQRLVPVDPHRPAAAADPAVAAAAATAQLPGGSGRNSAGAATGTTTGSDAGGGSGGGSGKEMQVALRRATSATDTTAYRSDPVFLQLSASLDRWYEHHWESLRPLRRGRAGRVLALHGAGMPAEWCSSMRPVSAAVAAGAAKDGRGSSSGGRGGGVLAMLRGCVGAAAGAAGSVFGMRHAPQVWEVPCVGAGVEVGSAPVTGRQQEQQLERAQEKGGTTTLGSQGGGGSGAVARNAGVGAGAGMAAGRGLAAAQVAATRLQFSLRQTMLVLPDAL